MLFPQEAILRYNVAYAKKWDFTALTDFCDKVNLVDKIEIRNMKESKLQTTMLSMFFNTFDLFFPLQK